ncbi:MFS transporter [Frankia sp. R82]|uniref:MFS transporter n=1 Tax=Frankia sp. R82 TaxID=2950553 RepID=UPI002042BE5B|nr:MFS transporter [Frankia sp. R82]MCM3887590.1 MFS transporter [Frankia sp. R82]
MSTFTAEQPTAGQLHAEQESTRRWWVLALIAVAQLMVVLDNTIVNVALPDAAHALDISTANQQWAVTAYALTFGALLLLGGRVADFQGRKRIFIIGMVGFAAASALGGCAQNAAMLFGARALQGVFAALLAPAALALLTVTFTEAKERATAFAVYGGITAGGAAVGLMLGGVLTEYATWRWCLLVNVPIAVLGSLAAVPLLRESRAHGDTRYDLVGTVLAVTGTAALVYGFTKAGEDGWSSGQAIALSSGGAVLLVLFALTEGRTAHPLLPPRIVVDRNRGGSYLVSLLMGAGILGCFLYLSFYLQSTLGYSPIRAGAANLPVSAAVFLAAGLVSRLLVRTGPRLFLASGAAVSGAGLLLLTRIGVHSHYVAEVLPALILFGLGLGLTFTTVASTALLGVADHDAGVASATINATQQVGGALGLALISSFFTREVSNYTAHHTSMDAASLTAHAQVHGYVIAFAGSSAMIFLAAVIAAVLVRAGRTDLAPGTGPTDKDAPTSAEPGRATAHR